MVHADASSHWPTDVSGIYRHMRSSLEALMGDSQRDWVGNCANASALVYHGLRASGRRINWAGFYVCRGPAAAPGPLLLGPFQGQVACQEIAIGRGVCGLAAAEARTIRVDDVHSFPGHIACDSETNSEIVVPLVVDGRVVGVLDIDCEERAAFTPLDQEQLEHVAELLSRSCDWPPQAGEGAARGE